MTSFQPFIALVLNEIHSVEKLSISDINDAVAVMLISLGAAIIIFRQSLLPLAITLTPKPETNRTFIQWSTGRGRLLSVFTLLHILVSSGG